MNEGLIATLLGVLGAMLGSFAAAQVWRLRARQLDEDRKRPGHKIDKAEYKRLKPLLAQRGLADRSIDLDTGDRLRWFELIPIVSWLALRGRSRYSGKPIGVFELLMEVGLAAYFVISFVFWPAELTSLVVVGQLAIWLVAGVILAIQFATDYRWQILWSMLSYSLIGLGAISAILGAVSAPVPLEAIYSALGAAAVLGGLYFVLSLVSRERWVGQGDVWLGFGLGLLLGDWLLALLALFLANLIGTAVVLIGASLGKIHRRQHVPLGPLLIIGTIIAMLAGQGIIDWYFALFFA